MQYFVHNFQKFSRPFMLLNKFYFRFQAGADTNTIFSYEEEWASRFVKGKYFSNFLGTVPIFGFRISMVEIGGRQIFIRFWLWEAGKFWSFRELFGWPTYTWMFNIRRSSFKFADWFYVKCVISKFENFLKDFVISRGPF